MKIKEYLHDHIWHIWIWILGFLTGEGVLLLFGSSGALMVFTAAVAVGTGVLILFYDFSRKKTFYNELRERLDQLEEKHLLVEMLEEPGFLEGRILYGSYEEILKSMNDTIGQYGRINDEFKRYVETWIHEIKIPIACAKLILHNNRSESSRRLKEQLGKIENDVEQVLYYIRSEVPQNDYSIGRHPLREIVETAVRENKDSLILNHFSVSVDIGDCMVFTDKKWMVFILGQIISNAVKYAREEERLLCFAGEKKDSGRSVLLTIEDGGIGIAPGDLPRIFEKSFTGRNGRKTASTGMGLYICRRLCEELGHRIIAESEEGEYTRIRIEFGAGGPNLTLP